MVRRHIPRLQKARQLALAELLTVTRPALLAAGSDAQFRILVHHLMALARSVNCLRDGIATGAGISGVQYELMLWVARLEGHDGVTVGEVGDAMRQSRAHTTIEAAKLVALGLLEKFGDRTDRRRVRLRNSVAGGEMLQAVRRVQRQVNETLFDRLEPDALRQLTCALHELLPSADHAVNLMQYLIKERQRPVASVVS